MKSCMLTGAELRETPLRGLDATSCEIGGITVDIPALRGLKVTRAQASSLAALLGLNIVDPYNLY